MRTAIWQGLRTSSSAKCRPLACRFVAGRRTRSIHLSALRRSEKDPPAPPGLPPKLPSCAVIVPKLSDIVHGFAEDEKYGGAPEDEPDKPSKPIDPNHYGSALRRAGRNIKRTKELPPVVIPSWLLDRNVNLIEESEKRPLYSKGEGHGPSRQLFRGQGSEQDASQDASFQKYNINADTTDTSYDRFPDGHLAQSLKINESIAEEISTLVQAGLRIPDKDAPSTASIKPHIALACPKPGGMAYLTGFVRSLAQQNDADFIRLSAQDIAIVAGDYLEETSTLQTNTLSSLGYDIADVASTPSQSSPEDVIEQEMPDEGDEEDSHDHSTAHVHGFPRVASIGVPIALGPGVLKELMKPRKDMQDFISQALSGQPSKQPNGSYSVRIKDDTQDMKVSLLLETILNAPDIKRARDQAQTSAGASDKGFTPAEDNSSADKDAALQKFGLQERGTRELVVLVEDLHLINMTHHGSKLLEKLFETVESRRKEGQAVLVVGASSTRHALPPGDSREAIDEAQAQPDDRLTRNVIVPLRTRNGDRLMWLEHKRRTKDINMRHIRDMLRKIAPHREQVQELVDDWNLDIDSKYEFTAGLDSAVLPLHKISRIATVALGLVKRMEPMTGETIGQAITIIESSDHSKLESLEKPRKKPSKSESKPSSGRTQEEADERMRKLRKKCNSHEKKLLNGVIESKNIRTTFADIHTPTETIETLKTLTSLSLLRPDAFTYGVLATDRIPGILLYGPPGTGKTLLAKAVAKESGVTMLEVTGSDVYDMYVGEGEKNVRAIFSLAKKLSPCVVFIDEADAILGARSSGPSRASHRELINQFLREWDGMTDTTAFIMVATNRPYDLDEASLRRVPRRLLVDLPRESDREAILKIHLKDEILDPEVSVPRLAAQTPFYSGSDLKNVSVAAALACVQEEYDAASAHNREHPEEKYEYAEKRTLHQRHFDKALGDISASISEDMGSLSAIRKFDEKYGDRKGRRKKLSGYGFKTVDESEKRGSDAARVRNQT